MTADLSVLGLRFAAVDVAASWTSLLPPLVAVLLAIWLRDVLVALFAAVFAGAWLLYGNPWTAALRSLDTLILGELAPAGGDGTPDPTHALILAFTLFLGAMVAVMARAGGTAALLDRTTGFATTRRRGQVLTWALGFLIFFDDYANTLLVGGTMRPLTDRLRISRAKLAFLIDATSAPVAGLAVVSTWVGVEIGYIADGYRQVGIPADAYTLFLQTLPYRFYPLYLIAFTFLIAWTGRDFGAMRRAEIASLAAPPPTVPTETTAAAARPFALLVALVPLAVLLVGLATGMIVTGVAAVQGQGGELGVAAVLSASDPTRMLFLAAFAASAAAVLAAVGLRCLTLADATSAWLDGAKSMLPAATVLVLAWAIARVCDADHLDTAGYLVGVTRGVLSPTWLPAMAFVLAGAVAFATGSSWSTMGLLMPLFIGVAAAFLPADFAAADPLLLSVMGAVLAGAIFGDHCSPISDTTVLSSAAAGCDHIQHVTTQMPYALTVGAVSLVCGYIPAGFGISPWLLLPVGLAVLIVLVRFCGRKPLPAA